MQVAKQHTVQLNQINDLHKINKTCNDNKNKPPEVSTHTATTILHAAHYTLSSS